MAKKPSPRKNNAKARAGVTRKSRRKPAGAAKPAVGGRANRGATSTRRSSGGSTKRKPQAGTPTVDPKSVAKARALEALDAAEPRGGTVAAARGTTSHPSRNGDFPRTYIKRIAVRLDDPDHLMTLSWTGPQAASQETGPFRTSPGAGVQGINCDNATTSRRSGTKCTPKGTYSVEGFQSRLNSDARATFVTWFMQSRGIALHYFPSVPRYAASHGCVRIESQRVAQLIQDNARVDLTQVVIDGTWTKPAKQW